jgi:pantothenate kinase
MIHTPHSIQNPQEAHARRGAHFTFDPNGILQLLQAIRDPANRNTVIKAPSFDHAKGDPVADDIEIYPQYVSNNFSLSTPLRNNV